jgi:hypothetical protein
MGKIRVGISENLFLMSQWAVPAGIIRELEEEEGELGRNECLGDLVPGNICHGFKYLLDTAQPLFGFFFDKEIRGTPATHAGMTGPGARGAAASAGGGTYTEITLVDQTQPFLNLALLETDKFIRADGFIL